MLKFFASNLLSFALLVLFYVGPVTAQEPDREYPMALVTVSVANMRENPSHAAEMATQCLLGTPLQSIEKKGGWLLVDTPEGYRCYVPTESVVPVTEKQWNQWKQARKTVFLELTGFVWERPDTNSALVSDLVAGSVLQVQGEESGFLQVQFPDGRTGFVKQAECMDWSQWLEQPLPEGEQMISTAGRFMGLPYLWGGTSSKMLDCSGMTKLSFFLHGIIVPRNASAQARTGRALDISTGYDRLQAGDLLFFGSKNEDGSVKRITHVGFYIENGDFIHEAGRVRLGSLNEASPLYEKRLHTTWVHAARFCGETGYKEIIRVGEHPFYKPTSTK